MDEYHIFKGENYSPEEAAKQIKEAIKDALKVLNGEEGDAEIVKY